MRNFENEEAALEYARGNIKKYDSEIVTIGGKKSFLSATSIPLEERLREPVEIAIQNFFEEVGYEDDDEIAYIGARISGMLIDMIEKETPLKIACAYQSY